MQGARTEGGDGAQKHGIPRCEGQPQPPVALSIQRRAPPAAGQPHTARICACADTHFNEKSENLNLISRCARAPSTCGDPSIPTKECLALSTGSPTLHTQKLPQAKSRQCCLCHPPQPSRSLACG